MEDRGNGPHGVFAHISMTVLEALASRGKEGLDQFGLTQLAQEAESVTPNIFVRVLKVVPNAVTMKRKTG